MVGIIVGAKLTDNLDTELIQRVIIGARHADRHPRVAPLDTTLHADGLSHLLIGRALLLILHLEQGPLPLQLKNR